MANKRNFRAFTISAAGGAVGGLISGTFLGLSVLLTTDASEATTNTVGVIFLGSGLMGIVLGRFYRAKGISSGIWIILLAMFHTLSFGVGTAVGGGIAFAINETLEIGTFWSDVIPALGAVGGYSVGQTVITKALLPRIKKGVNKPQ